MNPASHTPGNTGPDDRYILLETDMSSYHLQYIREGIRSYLTQSNKGFAFTPLSVIEIEQILGHIRPGTLGVIGVINQEQGLQFLNERKIPCINLGQSGFGSKPDFEINITDEGKVAAEYFLNELGMENLGFVGWDSSSVHARRLKEFQLVASARNIEVRTHLSPPRFGSRFFQWSSDEIDIKRKSLTAFLVGLRKPAGIFCGDERIALNLYFHAERLGFSVPGEISIIGIGSRDKSPEEWTQLISVVNIDHFNRGYLAAKLMEEYLLTGVTPKSICIHAEEIIHRKTTIRRNVADELVQKAMGLIQSNPSLSSAEICDQLATPRNILDARFIASTKQTVSKAIEFERFYRAKQLISNFRYGLESIASLSGYSSRRNMRRSFCRFAGITPQQYRDRQRCKSQSINGETHTPLSQ